MNEQENKNMQLIRLKTVLWTALIAATTGAAATVIAFFPAKAKAGALSGQTTQSYQPTRFVLEAAEINVRLLQPSGDNTQKMLFKLDTATGQVWVLQLSAFGTTNPYVQSANWIRVATMPPSPNQQLF